MQIMAEDQNLKVTLEEIPDKGDFIPKTVSAESEVNVETPEDSITTEKLKAGVHSYLKQNAEKISLREKFDDNMTGSDLPRVTTVDTTDQDHDNIQSVRIDEDSSGEVTATTTRIIRGEDGTTSKITTTEKFSKDKVKTGDQSVEKTVGKATWKKLSDTKISEGATPSDKVSDVDKDNLEDILSVLKTFNDMLISEELANPDLLDELFSLEFSDLMKMFYHLLSQSDDMEQTYAKMISGAKIHGVQKFAEELLQTAREENYDNISHNLNLKTITNFLASFKGNYEDIVGLIGNKKLSHLFQLYLNQKLDPKSSRESKSSKTESAP